MTLKTSLEKQKRRSKISYTQRLQWELDCCEHVLDREILNLAQEPSAYTLKTCCSYLSCVPVNKGLGMLGVKHREKNWDWVSQGRKAKMRVVASWLKLRGLRITCYRNSEKQLVCGSVEWFLGCSFGLELDVQPSWKDYPKDPELRVSQLAN